MLPVALAVLAMVAQTPAWSVGQQQWHLDALGVHRAHELARGDGVVVAVVDSGVDDTRPDLVGRVLPGTGVGDAVGTGGVQDRSGHGTAMAALIAGVGESGGVLGVAPAAKVLPVSVGVDGTGFTLAAVAEGVRWAVDHGADVVNLSLTSVATLTPELTDAVDYAFEHDVVVVAGTGNSGEQHVGAPADIPGVIAVAGTTRDGSPWARSNTGPPTVLAAPAERVVTAVPLTSSASGYAAVDGTSAATALVSGVVALVRSRFPDLDAANVVNRLVISAVDLLEPGRDSRTGFGLVNPVGALEGRIREVDRSPLLPPRPPLPAATAAPDPALASADRGSADSGSGDRGSAPVATEPGDGIGPVERAAWATAVVLLLATAGLVALRRFRNAEPGGAGVGALASGGPAPSAPEAGGPTPNTSAPTTPTTPTPTTPTTSTPTTSTPDADRP
ncbi:S8 family serine peptidase [Actinosynnema pretiosum subsp. pretiosum]|uniref:S8 family serine peptidase n=1 Tax=Actinosynnema pretiosum subsp. pretiosum TaxID=103721 RepID=A0AA45L203_9PSEU|nr:Serine protease [Actinosynnema pretiosum subsp. pretiosum]QUF01979.1 S8 family serine peptidase [Actinosynnema pretiosum subsp. pretiosum]